MRHRMLTDLSFTRDFNGTRQISVTILRIIIEGQQLVARCPSQSPRAVVRHTPS